MFTQISLRVTGSFFRFLQNYHLIQYYMYVGSCFCSSAIFDAKNVKGSTWTFPDKAKIYIVLYVQYSFKLNRKLYCKIELEICMPDEKEIYIFCFTK